MKAIKETMSRQQKWQIKKMREGKCPNCGKPKGATTLQCPSCAENVRINSVDRYRLKVGIPLDTPIQKGERKGQSR